MGGRRSNKGKNNKNAAYPKWARLIHLDEVGENGETIKLELLELSTSNLGQNRNGCGKTNRGRKQTKTGQDSSKTALDTDKNKANEKNAPEPNPEGGNRSTIMELSSNEPNPEEFIFISNEDAEDDAIMEVDLTSPTIVYPVQVKRRAELKRNQKGNKKQKNDIRFLFSKICFGVKLNRENSADFQRKL